MVRILLIGRGMVTDVVQSLVHKKNGRLRSGRWVSIGG